MLASFAYDKHVTLFLSSLGISGALVMLALHCFLPSFLLAFVQVAKGVMSDVMSAS
jgi:hypothetical protein